MTEEELERFIEPFTTNSPPMDDDLNRSSGLLEEN